MPDLEWHEIRLAGYGCMTCIGASGPFIPEITEAVHEHDLSVVSVLSGNRNFDGRVKPERAHELPCIPTPGGGLRPSPGTMDVDLMGDPLGADARRAPGLPSRHLAKLSERSQYGHRHHRRSIDVQPTLTQVCSKATKPMEDTLDTPTGETFTVGPTTSTYLRRPPYLDAMTREPAQDRGQPRGARVLVKLGDSVHHRPCVPGGSDSCAHPSWTVSGPGSASNSSSSTPMPHAEETTR